MLNYLRGLTSLHRYLTPSDRIGLVVIALVILATGSLWWKAVASNWQVVPVSGGTYTEGIIQQAPQDLDLIIAKLTRIGLTYADKSNQIQGALAESWEISSDGKTYRFRLRPGLSAEAIADTYRGLANWQNIEISTTDERTIVMLLKQPFSSLLSFASDPVVEAGPYRKEKQTKNDISFTANPDFTLGQPHIQRIVILLYPDERSLRAAMQRQEIMGADQLVTGVSGTRTQRLSLTRRSVLVFNLEKELFKAKTIRQKIKDRQPLDAPLTAILATNQDPHLLDLANRFREEMKPLGLTVEINSQNPLVLERDILTADRYDILLTDQNYGYDGDPYPYWHSSQIVAPGANYAGYNSKETDKLIEEARLTTDDNKRHELHSRIEQQIVSDIPAIFYPHQRYEYTVSTRLKGVTEEGIGAVPADRFTEVWRWFIKSKRQP